MRFTVFAIVILALGLVSGSAFADLVLAIEEAGHKDITIRDQGTSDLNPSPGIIHFFGDKGSFRILVTAQSEPWQGTTTRPKLVLNVHYLEYSGDGLFIFLTDTDFDSTHTAGLARAVGASDDGDIISFNFYGDGGNREYGNSFNIAGSGPMHPSKFDWVGVGPADPVGSLTILTTIASDRGEIVTSFDASLELFGREESPAELFDIDMIVGDVLNGNVSALEVSDDYWFHTLSQFGTSFIDLHNMTMHVSGRAFVEDPSTIDLKFETRIDEPAGQANISLMNWDTGNFDLVDTFTLGKAETIDEVTGLDASKYYNTITGAVKVEIQHVVFVPLFAFNFESRIDLVEILVE